MDFDQIKRRAWFSGSLIAVLAVLGVVMAALQYRWTGELSRAEQARLKEALQQSLNRLSYDLDAELSSALASLQPSPREVAQAGREAAYAARIRNWSAQSPNAKLFLSLAVAIPEQGSLQLKRWSPAQGFAPGEWPKNWDGMRNHLLSRLRGERPTSGHPSEWLVEVPRFERSAAPAQRRGAGTFGEQDWLILELDPAFVREVLLPRQIARHLSAGGTEAYQVEVYANETVPSPLLRIGLAEGQSIRGRAQASVELLRMLGGGRRGGPRPMSFAPPAEPGRGHWRMYVNPPGGSLETLVERTRWRNLALALTLLALIVATALLLVHSARQAQQLAELQMNFVSSVSHELRTPLTVIRTAAFNLRGRVAAKPEQVERYGKLIQEQSEKLGALVEQVLRYASSRVGQVIQEREAVLIDDVIAGGIQASQLALDASPYRLEQKIAPGLPLVLGDERALQHVVQNLLDNAVKYGTESSKWIGLEASLAGDFVELRVADQGPGIPSEEQLHIFDPFFRGRRALADQVQGTGLGLNLVKKIVEAHGGTIRIQSRSPHGAEFIVRIPVAPPEMQDEFAHIAG